MATVPFDQLDGHIWMNGEIVPWKDAKIHVLTHGLHYASCVFEGQRAYGGEVFKLREHTNRLIASGDLTRTVLVELDGEVLRPSMTLGMVQGSSSGVDEMGLGNMMRRPGTPEEIAELALFLSSERSSFINGTTTAIDGGASWH